LAATEFEEYAHADPTLPTMLPTALIAFELNVTPPTKLDVALLVVAIAPLLSVTPPMELEDVDALDRVPFTVTFDPAIVIADTS
jgi:hypothetical protein